MKTALCLNLSVRSFHFGQLLNALAPFSLIRDLENKTPAEMFPKYPSVLRVIERSDQNPPIAATRVTF